MTPAPYVNVHGQPVNVSARDAVLHVEPMAYAELEGVLTVDGEQNRWRVKRGSPSGRQHWNNAVLGVGVNEESAWREAWSRILAEEVAKEGR